MSVSIVWPPTMNLSLHGTLNKYHSLFSVTNSGLHPNCGLSLQLKEDRAAWCVMVGVCICGLQVHLSGDWLYMWVCENNRNDSWCVFFFSFFFSKTGSATANQILTVRVSMFHYSWNTGVRFFLLDCCDCYFLWFLVLADLNWAI